MAENAATGRNSAGYPLWDWPVRLIHWLIVLLLPASWWTAEQGKLEAHQWLGLTLLVAVVTRLCWGLIGSAQARFSDFLRGPGAVVAALRGEAATTPGHNAAGGWSAILLWLLLLAQALSGTVNSDDILFTGPFREYLDSGLADAIAAWHEPLFNILLAFVALHVLAIVYYERLRGKTLLRPMITGSAPGRHGTAPAQPLYKALIVAALVAGMLWALIAMAPEPSSYYW
ncbi:MAG: cytochrome b/b6 domain-containing protein [Halieaceae bacterium]|nr:cytochrome b/b6 domain-containing protein [Halieaceae bacterium]